MSIEYVTGYLHRVCSSFALLEDTGNKIPVEQLHLIILSFFGSFCGILLLSYIDHVMILEKADLVMLVGEIIWDI